MKLDSGFDCDFHSSKRFCRFLEFAYYLCAAPQNSIKTPLPSKLLLQQIGCFFWIVAKQHFRCLFCCFPGCFLVLSERHHRHERHRLHRRHHRHHRHHRHRRDHHQPAGRLVSIMDSSSSFSCTGKDMSWGCFWHHGSLSFLSSSPFLFLFFLPSQKAVFPLLCALEAITFSRKCLLPQNISQG